MSKMWLLFASAVMLVAQTPEIRKVRTTLDPSDGNPQNIRISLFSVGVLNASDVRATLRAIAPDGKGLAVNNLSYFSLKY